VGGLMSLEYQIKVNNLELKVKHMQEQLNLAFNHIETLQLEISKKTVVEPARKQK
jgi:hypothetical protein